MAYKYVGREKEYLREWRAANQDRTREYRLKSRGRESERKRRRKYSLGTDEYRVVVSTTECAVCSREISHGKIRSGDAAHIDHDHEFSYVRGVICMRCNMSIGGLGDDIPGLMRALVYLLDARIAYLKSRQETPPDSYLHAISFFVDPHGLP